MQRVLVTGNAGSGKSTAARKLAEALGLPYYSLDSIVWGENWVKVPAEDRRKKIAKLINQKSWVIDGVDYEIMRAADTVIFLDVPRSVCFWRVSKRNWKYLLKSRPELPAHCPEIRIIPSLVKIIWRFPSRVQPKILEEKNARPKGYFIHVRKNEDFADCVASQLR